jgi:hypothetical protein
MAMPGDQPFASAGLLSAYAGIRFGQQQQTRSPISPETLSLFLKDYADNGLGEAWRIAQDKASGETVTPEDMLLGMIAGFRADQEEMRSHEQALQPASFLGRALGLGQQLDFRESQAPSLQLLETLEKELQPNLPEDASSKSVRSRQPNAQLGRLWLALKQAQEKMEKESDSPVLASEEMMLGLLAERGQGTAQKVARQLISAIETESGRSLNVHAGPYLRANSEGLPSDSGSGAAQAVDINQQIKTEPFHPFVPWQRDLGEAVGALREGRNVVLSVPGNMAPAVAIQNLAHVMETTPGAKISIQQLDVPHFLYSDKPPKNVQNLIQAAHEALSGASTRVALYLDEADPLIKDLAEPNLKALMGALSAGGKGQILLISHRAPEGFKKVVLAPPTSQELADHVAQTQLSKIRETYPHLHVSPEVLQQASQWALRSGQPHPVEAATHLLMHSAKQHQGGSLDARTLEQHAKYGLPEQPTRRAGSYLCLEPNVRALEEPPEMVLTESAIKLQQRLASRLRSAEKLMQRGILPAEHYFLNGPAGTGKTGSILAIARQQRLPVTYLSGRQLQEAQAPEYLVHQAFETAKKSAQRALEEGRSPYVMIVVDDIDHLRAQVPNSQEVTLPLLNATLSELTKLKQEHNPYVFTVSVGQQIPIQHPMLAQSGLADQVISMALPTAPERRALVERLIRLNPNDFEPEVEKQATQIAERLNGKSGADIERVLKRALAIAIESDRERANVQDVASALAEPALRAEHRTFGFDF